MDVADDERHEVLAEMERGVGTSKPPTRSDAYSVATRDLGEERDTLMFMASTNEFIELCNARGNAGAEMAARTGFTGW